MQILRCRRGEDNRAPTVASRGRSHSCPGAEADPHGPWDHGESTVAV